MRDKLGFIGCLAIGLAVLIACRSPTEIAKGDVRLVLGKTSATIQNGTLALAVPVINHGEKAAENVRIESVWVEKGSQKIPATLLSAPNAIGVGARAPVYAYVPNAPLLPRDSYVVQIEGTYSHAAAVDNFTLRDGFRIAAASPGSAVASSATVTGTTVTGGHYKPAAPGLPNEFDNEDTRWIVPIAPGTGPVRELPNAPRPTSIQPAPPPRADPPTIEIYSNDSLGGVPSKGNPPNSISAGSSLSEPSGGASAGGVVFASFNWGVAYSPNSGANWTQLNPASILPNMNGWCCDQHVEYIPGIDHFVWVIMFGPIVRIVTFSPSDLTSSGLSSWTYWDITPALLGLTSSDSFDFPYTSVGNKYLYVGVNINHGTNGVGLEVMRFPLSQIKSGGTIDFGYTNPEDSSQAEFSKLTQNAQDSIFWAAFNGATSNTNTASLQVYSWPENSNVYSWQDVNVWSCSTPTNATNGNTLVPTPDGRTWSLVTPSSTEGTTRIKGNFGSGQTDQLLFSWTAPAGCGFSQPQVEWITLDHANNLNLINQQPLYNADWAVAYPMLTTNSQGEVGISAEVGGGSEYENHVVGFLTDNVLYATTNGNETVSRYGDYVTIKQNVANGALFDAFGYAEMNAVPPQTKKGGDPNCVDAKGTDWLCFADVHYIVFGRPPAR